MSEQNVKVVLTPFETTIMFEVCNKVCCARNGKTLPTSATYDASDIIWSWVFGSEENVKSFMENKSPVTLTINLTKLGYDSCDFVC